MTVGFQKYIEKTKSVFNKSRHIVKADPYDNWLILVVVFVAINALLISGKFLEFYRISSDEALLSDDSIKARIETIDKDVLEETLSVFRTKKENYEDLKNNRPRFTDPSR